MSFYGIIPEGAGGRLITIEAQINTSAHHDSDALDIHLLGLPLTALKQGIARWQNALKSCNLACPRYEVTINLAPADLPKPGTTLEAPIVAILGILGQTSEEKEEIDKNDNDPEMINKILSEIKARNRIRRELLQRIYLDDWVIIGELRLTGELRSTRSLLGMISEAPQNANIIVPSESQKEASLLLFKDKNAKVYCAKTIKDVVDFILGKSIIDPIKFNVQSIGKFLLKDLEIESQVDFKDISGQEIAKRALEIGVAGGHSVLLFGPPGEGKTMLARAIPGIMPKITLKECFEINQIYSAKGLLTDGQIIIVRPFRQIHTTATKVNILGGRGMNGDIEPGEVSLAHQGVLFLDELPQFPTEVLEQLRAPLAEKNIIIGRATGARRYMCNFALVAAMNPCICGYYGEYKCSICQKTIWKQNGECENHPKADTVHKCKCSKQKVDVYLRRLSGPFLDRIDLKVRVFSLNPEQRFNPVFCEDSKTIRERIKKARDRQTKRYEGIPFSVNAEVDNMQKYFYLMKMPLSDKKEFDRLQSDKNISTRGAVKVIQVGRTIADLNGSEEMTIDHILQAMGFMGSSFNEMDIQIDFETSLKTEGALNDPILLNNLKEKILIELSRRRLSKNKSAKEIDISILTFNKVLRCESNISPNTISKIISWLNKSSRKSFR